MKITIQTPGFKANKVLLNHVKRKVNKIENVSPTVQAADVCLKMEKSDTKENKICEIKLSIAGNDLFAARQSETFEKSVGKVLDALKRQLEEKKNSYR